MGSVILAVFARDTEVGKRPAKGQIRGDLRIRQAGIGPGRTMREGNEHLRQNAQH